MAGSPPLIGTIVAPLINPNEPEAQVVALSVEAGQAIALGDVVCVLETSKATVDVEADVEGFAGAPQIARDERVSAGQVICDVFATPPEPGQTGRPPSDGSDGAQPRLTRKAARLAAELGVDLAQLPTNRFLTERDIEAVAAPDAGAAELDDEWLASITERSVLVFGGGGLAKTIIEVVRQGDELDPLCVVDDGLPIGKSVLGAPVVGGRDVLLALHEGGLARALNAVGAIGDIGTRVAIFEALDEVGFELPTIVDRTAAVAASAQLADGAQIFAQAVVGSDARVGRGAIVNSGAIVSHDCEIDAYAHVAPGAVLAGEVRVGEAALVGMAATARVGVEIGAGAIVGNASVLRDDVPSGTIVSAGSVWPRE